MFQTFVVKVQQERVFKKYSSYISSYQGFTKLQYVDLLLLDLQRMATSKNYNMHIYNLIYKELQL